MYYFPKYRNAVFDKSENLETKTFVLTLRAIDQRIRSPSKKATVQYFFEHFYFTKIYYFRIEKTMNLK